MSTGPARDASTIGLGLITATGATYALHAVAARRLTVDEFGLFGTYWSLLFTIVIVSYLAIEQSVTARVAEQQRIPLGRDFVVSLIGIAILASLTMTISLLIFGESILVIGILGLATIAYLPVYLVRGALAGYRQFGVYGFAFAGEAIVRLLVFAGLLLVGAPPFRALAWSLAIAPLTVGALAISFLSKKPLDREIWRGSVLRLGGAAVANLGLVAFVNLGPIIVALRGATAEAGTLFAALLVARAPLYFSQALVVTVLPRFVERIGDDGLERVQRSLRLLAFWSIPIVAGVVALATPLLKWVVGLLFDEALIPSTTDMAMLAIGVVLIVAGLVVNQFWIAADRTAVVARAWILGVLVFLAMALAVEDAVFAVGLGLVVGGVVLMGALLLPAGPARAVEV